MIKRCHDHPPKLPPWTNPPDWLSETAIVLAQGFVMDGQSLFHLRRWAHSQHVPSLVLWGSTMLCYFARCYSEFLFLLFFFLAEGGNRKSQGKPSDDGQGRIICICYSRFGILFEHVSETYKICSQTMCMVLKIFNTL